MPHAPARRLAYVSAARSAGRRWRSHTALAGIIAAAVAVLALAPQIPLRHGQTGLVLAAIATMIVISLVSIASPETDGRFAAQWGLDGLRRKRSWHLSDNVPVEPGHVDHVVVAPSAVLAVEERYRLDGAPTSAAQTARHDRDLDAAKDAARKIRNFLELDKRRDAVAVVPVLIVWGPGAPDLPNGHRVDSGVHVVDGTHPDSWKHLFEAPRLDMRTRRDLCARIDRRARKHDATFVPSLRQEMWRELRDGIAHERAQRAGRQHKIRSPRRHGLRLVSTTHPAPVPGVLPVAMEATQAAG